MAGSDLRQLQLRAREMAARFTPVQKIAIGAGILTIVVGALVVSRSSGDTDLSPLFTDLDAADASAIVDELAGRGVTYELTDAGRTVLVPPDELYELRLAMSSAGLPASSDGYALLDEQGITTSEFRQRIDYQRALEGELASTLRAMEGIASATVHLALPEDSVFVDEPARPTASVLLASRGTTGISDEQVDAVVHLVASSVKDLRPEDVTVVGAEGQVLSAPGRARTGTAGSAGTARAKAERAYEQDLSASLTTMLSRVTGPGNVAVTVSADLDLAERQSTSEDFDTSADDDGNRPVVNERTSSEVYATDGQLGATGVLGPDGAEIVPEVTTATDAGAYERVDEDRTFALDRVVEQVTEAPGEITRLNVAVLIDEGAVDAAQIAEIESMVAAAAGIDVERGDEVVVSRMAFDDSVTAEAEAVAAAEAQAAAEAEQMALYRTLAIVGLAVVALLFAFVSARRARRVTVTPIDIGEITAGPATAAMGVAPPPALDEPTAAGELGGPAHLHPATAVELAPDPGAVAVKELADLADRRPEEVASVLRTWLAEPKDRKDRR